MYRPMSAPALTTSSFTKGRAADPPSLGWILLLAVALFALVLPIVGPLDDHHFAERSHTHLHIYPDGRPAGHEHVGAQALPHLHSTRSDMLRYNESDARSPDVMYLTDAAASFLLAVMNAPYHKAPEALRPAPSHGDGSNPLTPFGVLKRQPSGHSIAPPLPPPIA